MLPSQYIWNEIRPDIKIVNELMAATGYPRNFCILLANRGLCTKEEVEHFLNPSVEGFHNPFFMEDMDAAVSRILDAVSKEEPITVYGDYDVDGITSTSILYLFLKELGAVVDYYIPDRLSEGYGVNEEALRTVQMQGTRLVITVDTGISAVKECEYAKHLGLDMIITDHHECPPQIPDAFAVLDPKREDCRYPFKMLAGVGVTFKLVTAIAMRRKCTEKVEKYLELAAVGTIADIVPLKDENRTIASLGFARMGKPSNVGLKMLLESSGYDFKRKITSGYIGFGVAPRLNAGGRMGDAKRGVRLFTTENETEAADIACSLNLENEARKSMEQEILAEALDKIEGNTALKQSQVIVVSGDAWHHGVIGIVSSRIKDTYYRSNIVLAIEDGIATGSARAVDGFNMFEALESCKDLLIKFGGHEAAAGLSLESENILPLYERLNAYAGEHMTDDMLVPKQSYELCLKPEDVDTDLVSMIQKMEPFGQGMEEPKVLVEGILEDIKAIGADRNTVRMQVRGVGKTLTAIGFRKGILSGFYKKSMVVRMIGTLSKNEFMGKVAPQLILADIQCRNQETMEVSRMLAKAGDDDSFRKYLEDKNIVLPRNCCNEGYIWLRKQEKNGSGLFLMQELDLWSSMPKEKQAAAMALVLCVFSELGLVVFEIQGGYVKYSLVRDKTAKLADSRWFKAFFN